MRERIKANWFSVHMVWKSVCHGHCFVLNIIYRSDQGWFAQMTQPSFARTMRNLRFAMEWKNVTTSFGFVCNCDYGAHCTRKTKREIIAHINIYWLTDHSNLYSNLYLSYSIISEIKWKQFDEKNNNWGDDENLIKHLHRHV